MQYRHSFQEDESPHDSGFSRRIFLGAGAALAAGATLGLAAPAFADPVRQSVLSADPAGLAPFGPIPLDSAVKNGSYGRAVRLAVNQPAGVPQTILATYQGGALYRSADNGHTWTKVGPSPASGFVLQPFLYELPIAFAGFPAGTLLFSCNALGSGSTKIQMYASTDSGVTWQFLSTVATGGGASTTNGATPVWEPFLLLHNGKLICYYSDQRDPNYGQKLSHQTSTDLINWGPVVNDVRGNTYAERPGMTSVAQLPNGQWIMTFEYGQPDDPANPDQNNYTYWVNYRLASDPELFDSSPSIRIIVPGTPPNSSPIVSWSNSGGPNGTIIVTNNDTQDFLINRDLGDPNKWLRLSSPMPAGYSRQTIPLDPAANTAEQGLVFVITGAQYGKSLPPSVGIISAADTLSLAPAAQGRSLAGSAYVYVTVKNTDTVPADITVTTPYGNKTFSGVQPGTAGTAAFNSHAASIPSDSVQVTGTAGSKSFAGSASYAAVGSN
ncbi:hypothetical protein GCM10027568_28220 [Humibacter soli]